MRGLGHERFRYTKGLHGLGDGLYAWLAPDGSWGWSNAGLVVDGEASLLVDTLFDLPLTREMLAAMRDAEPRAAAQGRRARQHPRQRRPLLRQRAGPGRGDRGVAGERRGDGRDAAGSAGRAGEGVPAARTPPSLASCRTPSGRSSSRASGWCRRREPSSGRLELEVGAKRVELLEVGPAHTKGDVLVHVPADRTIFSGDILFVEGTPIVWAGPVSSWQSRPATASSRSIAALIVPGHGPITDRRGVLAVKAYLEFVAREARLRFDAGLDAWSAARDIELGDFAELERRRAPRGQRRRRSTASSVRRPRRASSTSSAAWPSSAPRGVTKVPGQTPS